MVEDILNAHINKIEEVVGHIEEYINDDFCAKPVCVNIANGLEVAEKEITYFVFSELYFRNVVLDGTEKMLKYKDIMDVETYVFILRLRNKVQGNLFLPLIERGQTNIIGYSNIEINVNDFRKTFKDVGQTIVMLCEKILQ